MTTKATYLSVAGGLNYKSFLNHFKRQAGGQDRQMLVANAPAYYAGGRRKICTTSLVLVNLADHDAGHQKSDRPKLEVIDPTEAARKRAVSDFERDEDAGWELEAKKRKSTSSRPHSATNGGKRKTTLKASKSQPEKPVKKRSNLPATVRRVKDIFD